MERPRPIYLSAAFIEDERLVCEAAGDVLNGRLFINGWGFVSLAGWSCGWGGFRDGDGFGYWLGGSGR